MLGRKKTSGATRAGASPNDQLVDEAHPARPGAKNRPTPKRREAEAARRRPLIETDRKAAAQRDRAMTREERAKQQKAMMAGEEWALLPRDRGLARRYIRDVIDSRWNVAELTMPALILAMLLSLVTAKFPSAGLLTTIMFLTYGVIVLGLVEQFFLASRLKKRFLAAHPKETWPSRAGWYSGMRAFQIRPTRVPRPGVRRGQAPR